MIVAGGAGVWALLMFAGAFGKGSTQGWGALIGMAWGLATPVVALVVRARRLSR